MSRLKQARGLWIPLALLLIAVFSGCRPSEDHILKADPAFAIHIAAFSSGDLSCASTIKLRLVKPSTAYAGENKPVIEELFQFSPQIKGETFWIDPQTIEFKPSQLLPSGRIFKVDFALGKVATVESRFQNFRFGFRVKTQNFEISGENLVAESETNSSSYCLEGKLLCADFIPTELLSKILEAEMDGKTLPIQWTSEKPDRLHQFRIVGLKRTNQERRMSLRWNGDAIGVRLQGERALVIPPAGTYMYLSHTLNQGSEKSVYIYFSDILNPTQDLAGLVTCEGPGISGYSFHRNSLRVFFNEGATGKFHLKVSPDLQNQQAKRLGVPFEADGILEDLRPGLRALGTGTILPSSQGLVYPFEATGLKAVKLSIIKVFERNVAQFLQTNRIDGNYEMQRVGRPVFSQTIPLTNSGVTDFSRWNRFTLDLKNYLKSEPGAIYQIRLSFTPAMLANPCSEANNPTGGLTGWPDETEPESDPQYDGPGYYGYYDWYQGEEFEDEYNWSERDNPCNPAYYSYEKMITRNLMASDLGLLAKKEAGGQILVAVSNLVTANPVRWAKIEILDYQLQTVAETESDGDGLAYLKPSRPAFLLIATRGKDKSYLRLDDGSSLSLSNFDISGAEVNKGLKGFIYGERGVWRPGDTLFLGFILQDRAHSLPEGHPLVFELKNPKGQVVNRSVRTYDKTGIFTFINPTPADAPTGKWTASVKVGGTSFSKQVMVESIKPNRLKIKFEPDLNLPFGATGNLAASLQAKWLHGAPGKGLLADFEVSFTRARPAFKGYDRYTFDDIGLQAPQGNFPLFNDRLDPDGNATIRADLGLTGPFPAAMNATFKGKVFEPGGDFSIDFSTMPVLPFEEYVGIRLPEPERGLWLETDKDHEIKLVSINRKGKPMDISGIKVEVFKMDWSWWWQENEEGMASFINSNYQTPVLIQTISTRNGAGRFTFRIDYPSWGRFYVRATSPNGQTCGQIFYLDWPLSRGRMASEMPGGATMLALSADKSSAAVGDLVKVTVPGFKGARAFFSIENGSRVIKAWWQNTPDPTNTVQLRMEKGMAPNVFVHVSLIQPHLHDNDFPIRQYGIIPIQVSDPATRLEPVIAMPAELKPEKECRITISEKSGKPMTYTLAVVDEGLLDLTRFKTPDPHADFFAPEALGVKSFDLYDDVIGAFGGKLERLLSVGGDEALKANDDGKNVRFKPVVKFLGPFRLEKNRKTTHRFTMPNYVGSVRTMVVAAGEDTYGMAENTTPVRQDLMVVATLPRVLGPGEEVLLPVNVFALSPKQKGATIRVKTSGPVKLKGESVKNISFPKPGDAMVYFSLKALNAIGKAHIEVVAEGHGNRSTTTIDLPIRNPNPPQTRSISEVLEPHKKWDHRFKPFGLTGTNSAKIELSTIPPLNLDNRLDYLIHYPHGCLEQTTSGAFPQIFLSRVVELSPDQALMAENNVKAGIHRLSLFQLGNGGFMYWPGDGGADYWCTSYAGHFLLEARKAGYSVPSHMLTGWRTYQAEAARTWTEGNLAIDDELSQAYRLYLLALNGTPEMGAMNQLRLKKDLSPQAAWRLAGAYLLTGHRETALKLVATLPVKFESYRENYGSSLRDEAMILEVLADLGPVSRAGTVAKDISQSLNKDQWMSTQETAYSLIALSKFYQKQTTGKGLEAKTIANGTPSMVKTKLNMSTRSFAVREEAENRVQVENLSPTTLYLRLNTTGIPATGQEVASANNLEMEIRYLTEDGQPLDITRLKRGTDFRIEVKVKHPGVLRRYAELALTQVFPSGWEIRNIRLEPGEESNPRALFDYQDIRDDRVLTYFDLEAGEGRTFELSATATYTGRFYYPGTACSAMYDNSISASSKGVWVEVVAP